MTWDTDLFFTTSACWQQRCSNQRERWSMSALHRVHTEFAKIGRPSSRRSFCRPRVAFTPLSRAMSHCCLQDVVCATPRVQVATRPQSFCRFFIRLQFFSYSYAFDRERFWWHSLRVGSYMLLRFSAHATCSYSIPVQPSRAATRIDGLLTLLDKSHHMKLGASVELWSVNFM